MRPDNDDMAACAILQSCSREVARDISLPVARRSWYAWYLIRAIEHLARPERAIYPKTRKGTKRRPVVLDHGSRLL